MPKKLSEDKNDKVLYEWHNHQREHIKNGVGIMLEQPYIDLFKQLEVIVENEFELYWNKNFKEVKEYVKEHNKLPTDNIIVGEYAKIRKNKDITERWNNYLSLQKFEILLALKLANI